MVAALPQRAGTRPACDAMVSTFDQPWQQTNMTLGHAFSFVVFSAVRLNLAAMQKNVPGEDG
ncbi:MAG: hypothetical protein WBB85_06225 [Albidovulum sp.]|uniref:hypothetical protein n=1 Tax=Albidovulum sp. TaxID=1872424 RepID=UPI003C8D0AD3